MRGVLVLSGVLWSSAAFAYDAVPVMSFSKPTANGKYVLVMLHPGDFPRSKELKEKYGRSGLYPANDPKNPVWLCEWSAERDWMVSVSDDGVYAVRIPNGDPGLRHWLLSTERLIPARAADWDTAPALFLYKNGNLFRTLTYRDLFDCSQFSERDCFMGPVVSIEAFRDPDGHVSISSEKDDEKTLKTTVAFRTGEVIERGGFGSGGGGGRSRAPSSRSGTEGTGTSARSGDATEGRSWGRTLLMGFMVVGACSAAFACIAVLLVRRGARKEA